MTTTQHTSEACSPFLCRNATLRTDSDELPGKYDRQQQVWVVNTANGVAPLISTAPNCAEISTKTKNDRESDDSPDFLVAEISTKTDAKLEGDDQAQPLFLQELLSKTENSRERDD